MDRARVGVNLARLRAAVAWLARHWLPVVYWLLGGALVLWIGDEGSTSRSVTFSPGADYWEHSGALRALMASPWSPGNPHLNSPALSPRYTPIYLAVALVGRAFGADALQAMTLAACLNLSMLVAGVFWFFRSYFRDERAPLVALLVLTTSWWQGWHFSNVYQLGILPSVAAYPSTSALALTWVAWAFMIRALRHGLSARRALALVLLSALILLVHPLTAVLSFSGLGGLCLTEPGVPWKVRGQAVACLLTGAVLAHFWPYYSAFEVLSGGSHPTTEGWVDRAAEQVGNSSSGRRLHPLFYDWRQVERAVGLAAPGAIALLWFVWRRTHLFVVLGFAATLGVYLANMRVPLPLGHRFILLAMVYLHVATVWLWLVLLPGRAVGAVSDPVAAQPKAQAASGAPRWWRWSRRALRVLGWAVPLAALGTGLLHNLPVAERRTARVESRGTSPVVRVARQVARYAGPGAVVLGTDADTWALPTFGTKIVALLHINPLVADNHQRLADVARFLSAGATDEDRALIVERYGVTHVLTSGSESKAARRYLAAHATARKLASGRTLHTLNHPLDTPPAPPPS